MRFLSRFFDSNDRELGRIQPLIDATNDLEPEYEALSDGEIRERILRRKHRHQRIAGRTGVDEQARHRPADEDRLGDADARCVQHHAEMRGDHPAHLRARRPGQDGLAEGRRRIRIVIEQAGSAVLARLKRTAKAPVKPAKGKSKAKGTRDGGPTLVIVRSRRSSRTGQSGRNIGTSSSHAWRVTASP